MKRLFLIFLSLVFLAACAPSGPTPAPERSVPLLPYAPRAEDADLLRGEVFLDSVEVLTLESYPPQIHLSLQGNLPTPCHELRVAIGEPDSENRIFVEVYSLADPQAVCVQVLQPFEASLPLGSFAGGHYTLWVNGEQVGEFDV